ncbi:hypothetical protein Ga0074812_14621 [Parafrankia irregularis]|uniref:Uncharacterized protein n=1 Tax=Parafrankia irregularis TaxID=795642 RepID=A0A0S4R1G1_9ACTN|nr:hypothetical protein Ga0074812_14621 [Parafrankia irregularis]
MVQVRCSGSTYRTFVRPRSTDPPMPRPPHTLVPRAPPRPGREQPRQQPRRAGRGPAAPPRGTGGGSLLRHTSRPRPPTGPECPPTSLVSPGCPPLSQSHPRAPPGRRYAGSGAAAPRPRAAPPACDRHGGRPGYPRGRRATRTYPPLGAGRRRLACPVSRIPCPVRWSMRVRVQRFRGEHFCAQRDERRFGVVPGSPSLPPLMAHRCRKVCHPSDTPSQPLRDTRRPGHTPSEIPATQLEAHPGRTRHQPPRITPPDQRGQYSRRKVNDLSKPGTSVRTVAIGAAQPGTPRPQHRPIRWLHAVHVAVPSNAMYRVDH